LAVRVADAQFGEQIGDVVMLGTNGVQSLECWKGVVEERLGRSRGEGATAILSQLHQDLLKIWIQ
jgi:hypothetical protein